MYKIKEINGKIEFLLRAGKDLVKNEMPVKEAVKIIKEGKELPPEIEGYPINIDGIWHFSGEEQEKPIRQKREKTV